MKALILAAGLGTRLRPFTLEHPKALVPVGGVPMLERVLLRLKAEGFDEIVVNVHHFADQIEDFLRANSNFGLKISISDERGSLLDTGAPYSMSFLSWEVITVRFWCIMWISCQTHPWPILWSGMREGAGWPHCSSATGIHRVGYVSARIWNFLAGTT